MTEEKRLSLSFGNFSCDIVGYDEPFGLLSDVIDLMSRTAADNPGVFGFASESAGDAADGFADALRKNADALDLDVEEVDGRFIVAAQKRDDDEQTEAPAPEEAQDAAPAQRKPLVIERVAEPTADPAPMSGIAAEDAPLEAPAIEVAPAIEGETGDASEDGEPVEASREWSAQDASPEDAPQSETDADSADAQDETPAEENSLQRDPGLGASIEAALQALNDAPDAAEVDAHQSEGEAQVEAVVELRDAEPLELAEAVEALVAEGPGLTSQPETDFDDDAFGAEDAPAETLDLAGAETLSLQTPVIAEDDVVELTESDAVPQEAPEPRAAAADSAETEAAEGESAPKGPRVVVDQSRSRGHPRKRLKVNATVTRTPSTDAAPGEDAPLELGESARAASTRGDDAEENFLFDEYADAPEAPPLDLAEATRVDDGPQAEEDAPKRKRGPLGLGIFRRRGAKKAEAEAADDDAGFDRLRETAEAQLPKLEEPTRNGPPAAPERRLYAVSDGSDLDDADSPATFARQMGAKSLQDLLEASAAYMAIVEGKAKFSRRDVMQALTEIGLEKEYTPEARLKSFRKLVTAGSIVRADDGMFAISHATRFGYETQLRSG